MRLLRRGIGFGMARAHRNAPEAEASHHLADAALVQVHVEFVNDPLTQINQPPTHDTIALRIGPAAYPLGDRRRLRRRQLAGRAAAVRPVRQAGNAFSVEAMHPVAQRLPIHPALAGGIAARMPLQNPGNRQHPPGRGRIAGSPSREPQLRRADLGAGNRNRHRSRPPQRGGESHRAEPLQAQISSHSKAMELLAIARMALSSRGTG
jgi:hypothetical protein